MNREKLDRWCERGILYLMLAILVFGPLAMGAVRPLEFLIIQGLAIGVMLLWGARLWISPKPQLLWPPQCWVVVVFAAYAIFRYFTSDVEYVARGELIRVLIYSFIFLAALNNLHRQESTQLVGFTMIFLAMGISCYAIYQFATGSDHVWYFTRPAEYAGRAGGTYICPNHLAGFIELLLPLALSYALLGRSKPLTKILLGYAALVMMAGLGATVSRAAWVSCGVALVVFFCVMATRRGRRLPALLMLVMLLGCAIVFFVKTEPLKKRFVSDMPNQELTDLELRRELWDVAVRIWQDHPWLGAGPAHYDVLYRTYRPQDVQRQADRAHNEYLNVLADWGIVGGLIVVAGIGGLFLSVLKTWRHVRRSGSEFRSGLSNKFAFVLGASIGLLSLILHSAMDFNMEIPANAILAVTLTALLVSHLRFATERFWTSARPWMKVTLSTSLLATVVFLSWQEVGLGREYLLLDQASQKPAFSPARAAILEKAFAVQPNNFQTSYMIGEAYRMQSFEGGTNYVELAQRAMDWYERGIKINPYDGYNYLRYGMCLDWLEKYPEAEPYFDRAEQLDPNGYYMVAHIGRHYAERGDYAAARSWFLRSKLLKTGDNEIAEAWLNIVDQKLRQRATGQASLLER